tara:strand:+ start:3590 stop:4048 length:459 start_codon:yes stop_codon:yes gene_type:complete
MKYFAAICILIVGAAPLMAQVVPPNPNQFTKRNLGESGVGVNLGGATGSAKQTKTVHYTAVSPLRGWTNLDGKTIQARLMAFSAPAPGETGPVEVIRDGKVRLLISGKNSPVDYPLEQLKAKDKAEIQRIAEAAAQGPPPTPVDSSEEGKTE